MTNDSFIKGDIIEINQGSKDLTKTPQSVKRELPKYWTRDEINYKLDMIENHAHRMLFNTLWMSGIRITEAVNIRKRDLDFQNYMVTVRWLKSRKYKQRIVPLHPKLRDLLQLYTAPYNLDDRIFPISRQRAWQLCQKYFGGHPHQMRHSFAVNWLRCDGDLTTLHRILGHSKIQTTMEYLKIVPIDQGKELMKVVF